MENIVHRTVVIHPAETENSEIRAVKEELSRIGVLMAGNKEAGVRQISSYIRGGSRFISLQLGKSEFLAMEFRAVLKELSSIPDSIDYHKFANIFRRTELEPDSTDSLPNAEASI